MSRNPPHVIPGFNFNQYSFFHTFFFSLNWICSMTNILERLYHRVSKDTTMWQNCHRHVKTGMVFVAYVIIFCIMVISLLVYAVFIPIHALFTLVSSSSMDSSPPSRDVKTV